MDREANSQGSPQRTRSVMLRTAEGGCVVHSEAAAGRGTGSSGDSCARFAGWDAPPHFVPRLTSWATVFHALRAFGFGRVCSTGPRSVKTGVEKNSRRNHQSAFSAPET
jgi:hypothetical protein